MHPVATDLWRRTYNRPHSAQQPPHLHRDSSSCGREAFSPLSSWVLITIKEPQTIGAEMEPRASTTLEPSGDTHCTYPERKKRAHDTGLLSYNLSLPVEPNYSSESGSKPLDMERPKVSQLPKLTENIAPFSSLHYPFAPILTTELLKNLTHPSPGQGTWTHIPDDNNRKPGSSSTFRNSER